MFLTVKFFYSNYRHGLGSLSNGRIITTDNRELNWAEGIKYLGVYIDKGRTWSSLKPAKQAFYRAFNSIFGKIGRVAPENVVIDLLKCKCLPALLYSL